MSLRLALADSRSPPAALAAAGLAVFAGRSAPPTALGRPFFFGSSRLAWRPRMFIELGSPGICGPAAMRAPVSRGITRSTQ